MPGNEPIRRICIIFGGGLGDLVVLLPSLLILRDTYPHAHMALLGNPLWLGLLEDRGYVDKTYSLEALPFHLLFHPSLPRTHPFFEFLKGFDLLISWFGDQEGIFERNVRSLVQSRVFVFPFRNHHHFAGHVSEYYLSTLKTLGIPTGPPCTRLLPCRSSVVMDKGPQTGSPHLHPPALCIHPGSGSMAKNWALSHYIYVAQELTRQLSMQVYLLLGPAEKQQFDELKTCGGIQSIAILKDLSVPGLATVLERSCLYLGNDSGPTHLAAVTGIPTVAIFGPTSPERWAPRGPRVHVLQNIQTCSPCEHDTMQSCSTRRCLMEITPDAVLDAILSLI